MIRTMKVFYNIYNCYLYDYEIDENSERNFINYQEKCYESYQENYNTNQVDNDGFTTVNRKKQKKNVMNQYVMRFHNLYEYLPEGKKYIVYFCNWRSDENYDVIAPTGCTKYVFDRKNKKTLLVSTDLRVRDRDMKVSKLRPMSILTNRKQQLFDFANNITDLVICEMDEHQRSFIIEPIK